VIDYSPSCTARQRTSWAVGMSEMDTRRRVSRYDKVWTPVGRRTAVGQIGGLAGIWGSAALRHMQCTTWSIGCEHRETLFARRPRARSGIGINKSHGAPCTATRADHC